MKYKILLTDDAVRDLEDIDQYIAGHDSVESADAVLDNIEAAIPSLAENPHRGTYPDELSELGIHEYRELFFKPYRVIYRVFEKQLVVYIVADGRRDMGSLLNRRLLGG